MALANTNSARIPRKTLKQDAQVRQTASIDEWWDARVNRPLAAVFVRSVAQTAITPNQITVISAVTGIGGGVAIGMGSGYWPAIGGLLLLIAMILDCADGQLARLRGGGTFIGRMMDGYADWLTALALHIGLWSYFHVQGFHLFGRDFHGLFSTFLVALSAGVSMGIHSMLYDYYKNRYLRMTGEGKPTSHHPDEVVERIERATSWGERFYLRLYWAYCKSQTSLAADGEGAWGPVDPAVATVRRRYLGRNLRLWGFVGPTHHLVILAGSAILAGQVWWGMYVYLVYTVVLANLYTLLMMRLARRAEAEMDAQLEADEQLAASH